MPWQPVQASVGVASQAGLDVGFPFTVLNVKAPWQYVVEHESVVEE
jgi:hypothetical protein